MKTAMIVFGILFLVVGILTYYVPMQEVNAGTTVDGDVTNTSANLTVPLTWSYALMAIGGLLLIFGLIIPGATTTKVVQGPRGPRGASARRRNYRRSTRRVRRGTALPRGTSVTTTTRIRR